MKTILYNPIFINPQAYYVFPRLTRYLQPDNESTAEPANYIGTIEVKVIAYGDTTLKRTYTNTDSIDLSEFKNTWIRISLFTKVGSCVLGEWKIGNMESDLPYIDPEVLASLKAVVIVGNKTNNDSDRAIVKNLVDPDNPFVISNAAYTEGSGYADKDSPYYGAFVTDGIDDLITSTKTVQEMLGESNEITVVSMIHQVKDSVNNVSFTNYIRGSANGYFRNIVNNYDKTGIYGYTSSDLMDLSVVNNILGDKNDYTSNGDNRDSIINGNFSVQGYSYNDGNNTGDFSSVAWYWTVIANKVLTTDQINQVIAYFNLDRTLKPDILCNTIKQGITNENHAEFGDKLIDFSGNGRDIQLNNIAWKGDSGIGKYEVDFASLNYNNTTSVFTATYKSCSISKIIKDGVGNIFYNWGQTLAAINSTKIQVIGLDEIGAILEFTYLDESGNSTTKQYSTDGIYDLPASAAYQGDSHNTNFRFSIRGYIGDCDITITQIPSHAGALLLDGVDDFGKVTGMPVYKDYTVVTDREIFANTGAISSKNNPGAFVETAGNSVYSFGQATSGLNFISTRSISYLSKYSYCGQSITAGAAEDGTDMWLGTIRDNDTRFFNGAIYSLMTFPYSMSEFLIERQLKKHKLGTLYPDMVEWRPIIKSNVEYASISYLLRIPGQGTVTPVIGQYYPILSTDTSLVVYVATNGVDEVANLTINGQEPTSSSIHVDGRFKFEFPFNNSPQKINITIDEYIRYEDIDFTNCYPGVPRIYVNDKSVTWGDKLKVGDEFTFYGNVNILPEMYNVLVKALYNGEEMVYGSIGTISKSMVFTSFKTYIFDDNEPKCILSPRLLSIPNSSYKILGYIPDISGHGNNGVINNSAYAEGSGVNEDGSYQFDGVDDFVTIPTVTGGKQVLMKVNWQSDVGAVTLYDQRLNISDYEFAIYNGTRDLDDNPVMAYQGRNNGQTYIDGILNSNIMASELKAITHNITITNELSLGINNTYPVIGSTRSNTHFAQMSLYDFMLFDEISTDDKIKELNEYVGIEAKVELPPYYWDTYGKTNLDADKATIQQRGVAVGNYDLTNYNHAYDKMSGYGGYKFAKFDNELDWYLTPDNGYIDVVSRNGYSITLRNLSTSNYGWYFQNSTVKEFITKDIPFKVKANKSIRVYWDMHSYKSNGENFGYVVNNITLNPNEDTSINLRHLTEEELTELDANKDRMYYLLWFDLSTLAVDEEVTIEMLPLYPNGLLYDGVTDYSENVNIPTFNDFTLLVKASLLNGFIGSGGSIAKKGNNNKVIGGGYDFIYALDSSTIEDNRNSYWSFGAALRVSNGAINPPLIGYMTKNNVNGVPMSSGANPSIEGITFSKWEGYIKMVLYKAMLYPKTIPLLQINFLKNLMEKDEIIDLNNKIFIQE